MLRVCVSLAVAAAIFPVAVVAQQPGPRPTCDSTAHRAFDFWVGDWVVTDSAGTTRYGINEITNTEHGCILHEHWTGEGGGSGQSFNYYDRERGQWEQLWVNSTGFVLRLAGNMVDGAMVLQGNQKLPGTDVQLQEIRWTPQPDGRVRQTWRQSSDSSATWTVAFDGWYARRE